MEIPSMAWRAAAAAASVPGPATTTTPGPTTAGEDQAGDRQRFEEALGRPSVEAGAPAESIALDDAIAAAHPIDSADMASSTGSMDRLGDEILRSVDQAHRAYEQNLDRINQEIGKSGEAPMSVSRLMQIQFDVMKFGLDQDLTTKIADKTTQGFETVLKNQG
jgi:Type III secretion basal body protein I, YscI, HrpB, PscI